MASGKTVRYAGGDLEKELKKPVEETLPDIIIHIVLPLPPAGEAITPPATMSDSSYEWLKKFHAVCKDRLSRFTLSNGQQVVLAEMRWVDTRDGREQYSSTDAPYGHSTHTLGIPLEGSMSIHSRDPADWAVAWFDLQQGKGRSMGIQELTWKDFADGTASSAMRKLERVAAHIRNCAAQDHRTVMFSFQPIGKYNK